MDRGGDGPDGDDRSGGGAPAADPGNGGVFGRVTDDPLAAVAFLALGVLAFLPTLDGGFVLQLDAVFAPDASHLRFALDSKGPLYYGRLPFVALLDAAAAVLPAWVVQRVVLVGVVAGAGYAAYAAAGSALAGVSAGDDPAGPLEARLFAGLLYAANPFVYVRLLAGQWYLGLGYAVLPLALVAFHAFVAGERDRPTRAVAWVTLVAVFDPHVAVLAAVGGGLLLATLVADDTIAVRPVAARTARFCVLAVGVNAYWLFPAAAVVAGGGSQLATVNGADLVAFSPRGTVLGNVPLSVSMLYGFWRGGYVYPVDVLPLSVVVGCFVLLLALAVYGLLVADDALSTGLALVAVVAGTLALGVAVPATAPVYRAFAATPVGAGMREAGKFVALVAVAYALLGARGVAGLRADLDRWLESRTDGSSGNDDGALVADGPRRRLVVAGFSLLLVSVPLVYTAPMVAGFGGQFEPTTYPDDWHAVDDDLDRDGDRYRVLYLPWHQYVRYDWAGGTVAAPAPLFFGPEVVASRDPDLGVGSQATDPTHGRLNALLAAPADPAFAEEIAALGIKYVVVSRTADYRRYDALGDRDDLAVVFRGDHLVLYENRAFEGGSPESWPADGPRVPWTWLAGGALVSAGTVGRLVRRRGGR